VIPSILFSGLGRLGRDPGFFKPLLVALYYMVIIMESVGGRIDPPNRMRKSTQQWHTAHVFARVEVAIAAFISLEVRFQDRKCTRRLGWGSRNSGSCATVQGRGRQH
jgi:hypothetical protein